MSLIGVLDYGAGNLTSVRRAIECLGYSYMLVNKPRQLNEIDKLIVPGVGAFKTAMKSLKTKGFIEPIKEFVILGKPLLGVCLGMQLLFDKSFEFGETKGLGLINGVVRNIPHIGLNGELHKVPHIGWNELLFSDHCLNQGCAVYFVHSYMAYPVNPSNVIAHCNYDEISIPAIVRDGNVLGCQFHPEKSGGIGLSILKEFITEDKYYVWFGSAN